MAAELEAATEAAAACPTIDVTAVAATTPDTVFEAATDDTGEAAAVFDGVPTGDGVEVAA